MRSPFFRLLICLGAAMLTVTAWCLAIVWTAHNFMAEGTDTEMSAALAAPLNKFGCLAELLELGRLPGLCLTLTLPTLLLTVGYFMIIETVWFFKVTCPKVRIPS